MRRFAATLDELAKIITFVICLVLVIPFFVIINQSLHLHQPVLLIGPVAVTIGLLITALYRPKEYGLDTSGLHIIRTIKPVTIPLHTIKAIMPVTPKELGPGYRTLGSGGFCGYFGRFIYKQYGTMTLYVTDRSKLLLITLDDDRKILISPNDQEGFLNAFNELKRK